MPQFYIDSTDFSSATSIYTDALFTTPAPDGYYASCGVVRQQHNGSLLPYTECIDCKGYERPVEGELLLDLYPDAAAAYSLNQLNTSYEGASIRVRRASDNTEQDIGFDGNAALDTSALATFCAGTNGYVVRWYDQSGNGNDATQATTSLQPQIVASGSVYLDNTIPTIDFQDKYLQNTSGLGISGTQDISVFAVIHPDFTNTNYYTAIGDGTDTANLQSYQLTSEYGSRFNGGANLFATNADTNQALITAMTSGSTVGDSLMYKNGALQSSTSTTNGSSTRNTSSSVLRIGAYGSQSPNSSNNAFNGKIQEVIWYPSDQSTNRTGIESNINARYNIYWDGSQPALLDSHPLAAAAYSLRALNSDYVGPLVRVRRASDNAEQDITALYDGSLNVSSLESFCAGTDGYVVRWYDQSGNSNDAVQATTSKQPKIYDTTTGVETAPTSGEVMVNWDGTIDMLASGVLTSGNATFAAVAEFGASGNTSLASIIDTFNDGYELFIERWHVNSVDAIGTSPSANEARIVSGSYDGSTARFRQNTSDYSASVSTTISVSADLNIGSRSGAPQTYSFSGYIGCVIVYNNATHALSDLNTELNSTWSIY